MVDENVIRAEKEYLVNVLGKKLIDSEERDNRKDGHRRLAKKYWPEEYIDGRRKHVHHIDFDHSNNVVSNLVVLSPSEHRTIHYMFTYTMSEETKQKISDTMISNGCCAGENNPMYGHNHTDDAKQQIGIKNKQHWLDNPERHIMLEDTKTKISDTFIKNGLRKGKNNPMYGKVIMNNGKEQMTVIVPWDKDMLTFGWKYGRLKRKA